MTVILESMNALVITSPLYGGSNHAGSQNMNVSSSQDASMIAELLHCKTLTDTQVCA